MATGLWPSTHRAIEIPLPPLSEQRRIVSELDAEAAQMEAVRALLPHFGAKIQRVLDRVWGTARRPRHERAVPNYPERGIYAASP